VCLSPANQTQTFQRLFKLSEGDVRLPKLLRQTVPRPWPSGGKTTVTELVAWSLDQACSCWITVEAVVLCAYFLTYLLAYMTGVRDLDVWFDTELSMRSHVSRVAQTRFYHLHRIHAIRRQLGRDVTARLVTALVLSRLDYCNAVLADLPASTLAPFQRVLHAPLWISSRVSMWLQLFESCTGWQSLRGSSTSCACWFTSHFWDTCRNISHTFWHWLPIFRVDLHCTPRCVATLSCHGHLDELATEPFLLLHYEHGTGCQRSWNCCDRRTRFVVILKHFCFILSTGTRIRTDSVMCPRSSRRGRNTSASVTVTVYLHCSCMPLVSLKLICVVRLPFFNSPHLFSGF